MKKHYFYGLLRLLILFGSPVYAFSDKNQTIENTDVVQSKDGLSINFQKIDVRSALNIIADFTGINFVTSDAVKGDISLILKNVEWQLALDVILKIKGLGKRQNGNIIWIAPLEEITKIEEQELKANSINTEFSQLTTQIIAIHYAKANEIANIIKSIKVIKQGTLSTGSIVEGQSNKHFLNATQIDENSLLTERGSVAVDIRTNSLLVQDVATKIDELRKVIVQLDIPVRQVMIETQIVEASDTFSRELGARLGFQRITEQSHLSNSSSSNVRDVIASGTNAGINTIANSATGGANRSDFNTSRGSPGGLSVDLGANGIDGNFAASYAYDIFKAGVGYSQLISLELSALEAEGRGKIIANPRLITANQKQASIKQGEERVFTVTNGDKVTVQTKEALLELNVTPQITPNNYIVMDVKITHDNFIPLADSNGNVAAALRKKEIVTQVLAKNGETIIIGGIYQQESAEGVIKVPVLGDIPILGNLFKKRSKRKGKVELLIFLTPRVIDSELTAPIYAN